jgi:hypothetical protein
VLPPTPIAPKPVAMAPALPPTSVAGLAVGAGIGKQEEGAETQDEGGLGCGADCSATRQGQGLLRWAVASRWAAADIELLDSTLTYHEFHLREPNSAKGGAPRGLADCAHHRELAVAVAVELGVGTRVTGAVPRKSVHPPLVRHNV